MIVWCLAKQSFNVATRYRFPKGKSRNWRLNPHIVNLPFKTNWRGGIGEGPKTESLIFLFFSLEYLNCWQTGCGSKRHKTFIGDGWKRKSCIPGFEYVTSGDGLGYWGKETHCYCECAKEIVLLLGLSFFLFNCLFILRRYICWRSSDMPSNFNFLESLL